MNLKIETFNSTVNNFVNNLKDNITDCVKLGFLDRELKLSYESFKSCYIKDSEIYIRILFLECQLSINKEDHVEVLFDYIKNNIDKFQDKDFKRATLEKTKEALIIALEKNHIKLINTIRDLQPLLNL